MEKNLSENKAGSLSRPFLINNRYRVVREIGHGGMGMVYLVQDILKDNFSFALKIFRQDYQPGNGNSLADIFKNEYEIMTRLKHPNLTRVYEFGEYRDSCFILMEYLKGILLKEYKIRNKRKKFDIMVQILRALNYIHSRNIIYGDLKPLNIMITGNTAKLMDFGLSARPQRFYSNIRGSLLYISPESLSGIRDFSMDIFSCGILFFEIITKKRFYEGIILSMQSMIDLLGNEDRYKNHQEKRLSVITDPGLQNIIRKMTAYLPEERYDDCSFVIADMNKALKLDYDYETCETKHSYVLGNAFTDRVNEFRYLKKGLFGKEKLNFHIFSGPSGVGKTRLFDEFRKYCRLNRIRFFGTDCMEGEARQYHSISEILLQVITFSPAVLLEHYGRYLRLILPEHRDLKNYEPPAVSDDPELMQRIILQNICDFIIEFSKTIENQYIIYFNDLQWIDYGSVLLLKNLIYRASIDKSDDLRIIIYANINEDKLNHESGITEILNIRDVRKYELHQLDIKAVNKYIQNIFGSRYLDKSLKGATGKIIEKVGSRPLFLQELIKSLLDKDIIIRDKKYWKLIRDIDDVIIPDNIIHIVKQKMQKLFMDDSKRKIIKVLSLLKINPSVYTIKAVLEKTGVADTAAELLELENLEILRPVKVKNSIHYSFSNIVIKDQIRESVENKGEISLFLGKALESLSEASPEELTDEIAYQYLQGEDSEKAATCYEICGDIAKKRYFNEKALNCYETAVELLQKTGKDRIEEAMISLKLGDILTLTGRWRDAYIIFKKALDISEIQNDTALCSDCRNSLGWLLQRMGQQKEALSYLGKSLSAAERLGYKNGISAAVGNIGDILYDQGKYENAMQYYERQLSISRELDDKMAMSRIMGKMGNIFYIQGRYDKAMLYYKKWLSISNAIDDKRGISSATGSIGNIHSDRGDYGKAMKCYETKLKVCQKLGDKVGICYSFGNMGIVYYDRGEYEKAVKSYQKVISICEELGDKNGLSIALGNMGNVFFNRGDNDKAVYYYNKQRAICEELGDKRGIVRVLGNMGLVHHTRGEFSKSMKCFRKNLVLCEELGDNNSIGITCGNIGNIYADQGDFEKAIEYYEKQLAICSGLGDKRRISLAFGNIGSIHFHLADYREALKYYNKAIEISSELHTVFELSEFLYRKASLLYKTGKARDAEAFNREAFSIACRIDRKDIMFKSTILSHKIEKDTELLSGMLMDKDLSDEQRAEIHYELWKLTGREEYGKEAKDAYTFLLKRTVKYEYRKKLKELTE